MRLRLTPAAEADVRDIFAWYKDRGETLALDFRVALDACFDRIKRNPLAYQKVYSEIRRASLRRFPYCVFYLVTDSELVVIGVLHAHRDPKIWQSRYDIYS